MKVKTEFAGLGGFGNIGFFKNELSWQSNVPLPLGIVAQACVTAGHMTPIGGNKATTISDRFVLGGPMTLRGFQMGGVGPHSDGCAVGAEVRGGAEEGGAKREAGTEVEGEEGGCWVGEGDGCWVG